MEVHREDLDRIFEWKRELGIGRMRWVNRYRVLSSFLSLTLFRLLFRLYVLCVLCVSTLVRGGERGWRVLRRAVVSG